MPKRKFIADGTGKAPRKINKSAASFPRWRPPSSLQRRHATPDAALTIASNYKLPLAAEGKNVQKVPRDVHMRCVAPNCCRADQLSDKCTDAYFTG